MAIEDQQSIVSTAYARLYQHARPIPVVSPERLYVFGHERDTVNKTELIKYGGLGDFYIVRIPSQQLSIVVLGNADDHFSPATALYNSFLSRVVDAKPEKNVRLFLAAPFRLQKKNWKTMRASTYRKQLVITVTSQPSNFIRSNRMRTA